MTRVLIVDDDGATREMLRLVLEDADYTVEEAADGLAGLVAVQASDVPLIVLVDFSMPNLNGVEFLQAVARDARLAAQHVFILMTAMPTSNIQAAEEDSAPLSAPVLVKPFGLDTLLDQVSSAANRLLAAPPS